AYELLRKQAFDSAAKGMERPGGFREFYMQLPDEQRLALRPIIGNLTSAAKTADEELEQQREANIEAEDRGQAEQRLADPFGHSDIRGDQPADPIRRNEA